MGPHSAAKHSMNRVRGQATGMRSRVGALVVCPWARHLTSFVEGLYTYYLLVSFPTNLEGELNILIL